ncbi:MAG: hypothetical protein SGILL_008096 [Bacillariaceae sp.]
MTSTGQSSRLIFTGCQCAKCGQICEHPQLEHLTRATDVLRNKVDLLLEEQLKMDAPDVWKNAIGKHDNSSNKDIKQLLQEARRKYAFYLCSHCKEPYFGGTIECADDEIGLDDDYTVYADANGGRPPEQRLCVACAPQSQVICQNPLEHGQYLVWKCRYCCKPSTHVCYGNVHFCDNCHDRNSKRHREIQQQQRCHRQHGYNRRTGGAVRPPPLEAIPCPGDSCPYPKPKNEIQHCNGSSPTDCEQVYSCVLCQSSGNRGYHHVAEPRSHNLVSNSSGGTGLHGWQQLSPSMSWVVEESELPVNADTTTNFVSSFVNCVMMQRIDLSRHLRPDAEGPIRIEVSSRYMGRTDCPSVFRMNAILAWTTETERLSRLYPRFVVQQKATETLDAPPDYWERASLELSFDPRMVALQREGRRCLAVYVIVAGKDQRFWQGTFGSKVSDISVRILGSPERLESIMLPEALFGARREEREVVPEGPSGQHSRQLLSNITTSKPYLMALVVVIAAVINHWHICHAFVQTPPTTTTRRNVDPKLVHALTSKLDMISKQQLGTFEALDTDGMDGNSSRRQALLVDYTTDPTYHIAFETAWDYQKQILGEHMERLDDGSYDSFLASGGGCDTVIMLQHDPVYTLGTGSDEKFVLALSEKEKNGASQVPPVIRMDRGGEVTYHGPGQLTVYPVLDLRSYRQDIHWYMRALEEAIILALSRCGMSRTPERQDDVTGVWVDNCKVAAVGIKCRKWITMHGLAVNVEDESLSNFGGIVPCGLEGRKVGCINQFLDEPITVGQFAEIMKQAIEEIFKIELVQGNDLI